MIELDIRKYGGYYITYMMPSAAGDDLCKNSGLSDCIVIFKETIVFRSYHFDLPPGVSFDRDVVLFSGQDVLLSKKEWGVSNKR